jgi:hypothetical protein
VTHTQRVKARDLRCRHRGKERIGIDDLYFKASRNRSNGVKRSLQIGDKLGIKDILDGMHRYCDIYCYYVYHVFNTGACHLIQVLIL